MLIIALLIVAESSVGIFL